nr:hypothetical protein [Lachnospiraceae bacterium]
MMRIILWGQDFEQEIKPLIKAFFPGAEFQVEKEEWAGGEVQSAARFLEALQEDTACRDYAFLLYPTEGYVAVRCGDGWQAAEFHGVSPEAERKEYRNTMMRELYRLLVRQCGRELPWGMM